MMHLVFDPESGLFARFSETKTPHSIELDAHQLERVRRGEFSRVLDGALVFDEPINIEHEQRIYQARHYLNATDFYVTRKLETGIAVPKAISTNRDKARAILADNLPDFE